MNLSPQLVLELADLFPNSNHVYAVNLDHAQDADVYEYARREGFMPMTARFRLRDPTEVSVFPVDRVDGNARFFQIAKSVRKICRG